MTPSSRHEYDDAMAAMLQLLRGEGFMVPGGKETIDRLAKGLALRDKLVLDIGSGLGGPAFVLAEDHGARVIGIDLEALLVQRAQTGAQARGLAHRVEFLTVEQGALPFDDHSFDFVTGSNAFTRIEDKFGMFRECYRVLKPAGVLSCHDCMRTRAEYGAAMRSWLELQGLSYSLETLERHGELLEAAGFVDIELQDASEWYRSEVAREYDRIRGPLYTPIVEAVGRERADRFVENWRAMAAVCESGEMRQGYCRGRRPP